MDKVTISHIITTPLKRVNMEEGDVLHGIKNTDKGFLAFGEAYFSSINYGAIKGWKRHLNMTLNLVVPVGKIQFVFLDEQGNFLEEKIGSENYIRITIPPGIWFAFKGLENPSSLLLNIADIPHDPNEIERKDLSQINYKWEKN
jgi:dTDP-4-dehydrorhamnose 3,5-epimerase